MKLLIITQAVDKDHPVLSFFHNWIEKLAGEFEFITVICLEKGRYNLPSNVKVLSLGKEEGKSRLRYLWRFYKYIWQERKNYDAVFVHMNQEYILLGAKHWWLMRKPIYMWRNHHAGNWLTDLAAMFCRKVFCPSKYSYTAKYKKTVLMPVGVDTEVFSLPVGEAGRHEVNRKKESILFLGRIARVKKPDLLIGALSDMKDVSWSASIVGDALPKDMDFYEAMKKEVRDQGLEARIKFQKGVPNTVTPAIYQSHEIFVNLSSSGMYDKTIFEAMGCGCIVLASNQNLSGEIDSRLIISEEKTPREVAEKIKAILDLPEDEKKKLREQGVEFVKKHSLERLAKEIRVQITS